MPAERLIRPWLSLAASLLLLFAAVWIVLPAPSALLLPLAVGAPELSAWLLFIAVPVALSAALDARRHRAAATALAVSASASRSPSRLSFRLGVRLDVSTARCET